MTVGATSTVVNTSVEWEDARGRLRPATATGTVAPTSVPSLDAASTHTEPNTTASTTGSSSNRLTRRSPRLRVSFTRASISSADIVPELTDQNTVLKFGGSIVGQCMNHSKQDTERCNRFITNVDQ